MSRFTILIFTIVFGAGCQIRCVFTLFIYVLDTISSVQCFCRFSDAKDQICWSGYFWEPLLNFSDSKFLHQLKERLTDGHKEACGWRHNPSSEDFTQLPGVSSPEELRNLANSARILATLNSALPYLDNQKFMETVVRYWYNVCVFVYIGYTALSQISEYCDSNIFRPEFLKGFPVWLYRIPSGYRMWFLWFEVFLWCP